jgi:5-methylcytosine-specific restriction protein A
MPGRAAKPCTYPGCHALVRDGTSRCEKHPPKAWLKRPDSPDSNRLRGRAGVERRARWLSAHPLCVHCEQENPPRVTAGAQVDHVIPLEDGGRDDESNFQTLCKPHHDAKSQADRARRRGGVGCILRATR